VPVAAIADYDDNNIFARILRGEIPNKTVYEDQWALAFHDINPQAPVHVLFVPKLAVANTDALGDDQAELVGRVVLAARSYARQVGIAESGYRMVMNTNGDGGQTVFHLHLHLLGGRQLSWPPG
jgi:histidine triad (HIT) family protein